MKRILIPFPDQVGLAEKMAQAVGAEVRPLTWRKIPDGESLVSLEPEITGAEVAILASLDDPDLKTLPVLFAAATARELGAAQVGLIAPYLGYMRQDTALQPGDAVGANHYAWILDNAFDWLVTADPHPRGNPDLQGLFWVPAGRVETAPLVADWIRAQIPDAVIVGPDNENRPWVADLARRAGRPYQMFSGTGRGHGDISISAPARAALRAATPVIVDDIASSGQTMIEALSRLKAADVEGAVCVVIHPVFSGDAFRDILTAGAARVVSTDTVSHDTNQISVAPLLAEAVADRFQSETRLCSRCAMAAP